MADVKKVWSGDYSALYLDHPVVEIEKLDNVIYKVNIDGFGRFYLTKVSDDFSFDYKLYGLETKLVDRVLKTYQSTDSGNLGVLLNGLKGTGKTVTSKIIANKLNQPIILVTSSFDKADVSGFLNSISQNITIFIDEYEKIFGESTKMLTIMDGALNSEYRRVFLLTTNKLYLDENLIQRPSRIRYLKKFDNLMPEVVQEIVDDLLIHKQFSKDCVDFISNLETITVDIVKSVLSEVNIHAESPATFQNVFNVKKIKGKYNVLVREPDGTLSEIAKSVNIFPKPNYHDELVDYRFEIDGTAIGTISRVIGWTSLEITPYEDDNGNKIGFKTPIVIKIEDADSINYTYAYSEYGMGGSSVKKTEKTISPFAQNIIKAIEKAEEEDDEVAVGKDEYNLSSEFKTNHEG